jgi:hypothetical protein
MSGLRSKTFTFNPEAREAINFYVWDSNEAAKAFFNDELCSWSPDSTACGRVSRSSRSLR